MLEEAEARGVGGGVEAVVGGGPTATAVGAATEDAVPAMWQGLGYYRRAGRLHGEAKAGVARFLIGAVIWGYGDLLGRL